MITPLGSTRIWPRRWLPLALALLLGACASAGAAPPPRPATAVPIFYGTNRNDLGLVADPAEARYGNEAAQLSFGLAQTTIPPDHRIGVIDAPSLLSFGADPTEADSITLRNLTAMSQRDFLDALKLQADKADDRGLLIFIHGFNTSFADAIKRTAQLAFDLDWKGAAVVFSWPSEARLLGFDEDLKMAEASAAPLRLFLQMLATRPGRGTTHLIAHSMGNRVLLRAADGMSPEELAPKGPPFQQIVLAAPEMERELFVQLADRALVAGKRVTLYASEEDWSLILLAQLDGRIAAGTASGGPVVLPGLDTIDASAVEGDLLGHSYYGDSRAMLADLHALLQHGRPPEERFGLQLMQSDQGLFWRIKP